MHRQRRGARLRPTIVTLTLALLAAVVPATPAAAATSRTWVGPTGGVWSNAANWSPAGAPQNGDTLVFSPTSPLTTVLDMTGLTIADITTNSSHNIAIDRSGSQTLGLSGNITAGSANSSSTAISVPLVLGAGQHTMHGNIYIAAAVSGPGGITKTSTHNLTLAGAGTDYAGPTIVSQGALIVRQVASLGSTASGTTVSTGGTLDLNGSTAEPLTISGVGNGGSDTGALRVLESTLNGPVTLAGDTTVVGGGLTINGGISGSGRLTLAKTILGDYPWVFGSASTYTGGTVFNGRVVAAHDNALGSGPIEIAQSSTLAIEGVSLRNPVTVWGGDDISAVTVTTGTGVLAGGLTVKEAWNLRYAPVTTYPDTDLVIDGGLHGPGTFRMTGDGVVYLVGSTASTISGQVWIQESTLVVVGEQGVPLLRSNVAVGAAGHAVFLDADDTIAHDATLSAESTLDLYGTSQQAGYLGLTGVLYLGVEDENGADYSVLRLRTLWTQGGAVVAMIGGVQPGVSHDQIVVTSAATLDGVVLDLSLVQDMAVGSVVRLLDNQGSAAIAGEFDALPQGQVFDVEGATFRISYTGGDGNDVTLTRISNAPPAPPPSKRSGYWMVGAKGAVYSFGDARHHGNAPVGSRTVADLEPATDFNGYWIVDDGGQVFSFGSARWFGNVASLARGESVTALSATKTGKGYWIFTNLGRAVPFGDAVRYGDMYGHPLNGPVLDSIRTSNGNGYYMVGSDGGIFSFGDARFFGSMGGQRLNAPVRSLVPDPDGTGYWLVAGDGGVFAFQAGFRGSMGGHRLNRPVVGMVPYGSGYLMVAADGGIFSFSDKPFAGSLGASPPAVPIVGVAALNE